MTESTTSAPRRAIAATPIMAKNMPYTLPHVVAGDKSPYPTVAIVTTVN